MAASDYIADLIKSKFISSSERILDIGGGRNPFPGTTHVIDKRSKEEVVGKTGDLADVTWVQQDFYTLPWPFPDDYFDFSICIGTIEDVKDPIALLHEIERVSKKGYVACPTRALESFPYIIDRGLVDHGMVGYCHHRWFVEIIEGRLLFTNKTHLSSLRKKCQIFDVRQKNLNFFWCGNLPTEEVYLFNGQSVMEDAARFKSEHQRWLSNPDTAQYSFWDQRLGDMPDFTPEIDPQTKYPAIRYYIRLVRRYLSKLKASITSK